MMLLQIDFTNLANPNVMTEGLAVLVIGVLAIVPFIAFRLRSAATFVVWGLTLLVAVSTFITDLSFIWFWILVMIDAVVIAVSATVYYLIE